MTYQDEVSDSDNMPDSLDDDLAHLADGDTTLIEDYRTSPPPPPESLQVVYESMLHRE